MTIRYALYDNPLLKKGNILRAVVLTRGGVDYEDMVDVMIQRGSTVGKADIYCVLEDFFATVIRLLLDGYSVQTPLANFSSRIKGNFDSYEERYDPGRHQVIPGVNPGVRLRQAYTREARIERLEPKPQRPAVSSFEDIKSGERNDRLSPGGIGIIKGRRLKYDPQNPAEGIFFVDANAVVTQVQHIAINVPTQLIISIPETLLPGDYTLEVRSIPENGRYLLSGSLSDRLTVS